MSSQYHQPSISPRLQRALIPYLCLLPAVLLIACVLLVPIGQTFLNAFRELDRYGNPVGTLTLANFRQTFEDADFRRAFWNTVVWTISVVGLTLLVSLPAALVLDRRFPGRRIARAILVLPWASSLVISALIWRYILDTEMGPLNALLMQTGIVTEPVAWTATRSTSFPAMIFVGVFVSVPFTAMVFLAGLQSIGREMYEAARVDGASALRTFWSVTLPHLRGVFAVATVLNVIYVFNSFPIVWTITRGQPANTTDVVMTYLYKKAFTDQQFGVASAQAVIVFFVLLAFSIAYGLLLNRRDTEVSV